MQSTMALSHPPLKVRAPPDAPATAKHSNRLGKHALACQLANPARGDAE
jgi:hypothetical protein